MNEYDSVPVTIVELVDHPSGTDPIFVCQSMQEIKALVAEEAELILSEGGTQMTVRFTPAIYTLAELAAIPEFGGY